MKLKDLVTHERGRLNLFRYPTHDIGTYLGRGVFVCIKDDHSDCHNFVPVATCMRANYALPLSAKTDDILGLQVRLVSTLTHSPCSQRL